MKYLKILYDWVLGWAEKPAGPKAIAEISCSETSFPPILMDVLLIPINEKIFQA